MRPIQDARGGGEGGTHFLECFTKTQISELSQPSFRDSFDFWGESGNNTLRLLLHQATL